jgi:hypothetical protein
MRHTQSDPTCEVKLHAHGFAPKHAYITAKWRGNATASSSPPHGGIWLHRLTTAAPKRVLVNGRDVTDATPIHHGDVIEFEGCARFTYESPKGIHSHPPHHRQQPRQSASADVSQTTDEDEDDDDDDAARCAKVHEEDAAGCVAARVVSVNTVPPHPSPSGVAVGRMADSNETAEAASAFSDATPLDVDGCVATGCTDTLDGAGACVAVSSDASTRTAVCDDECGCFVVTNGGAGRVQSSSDADDCIAVSGGEIDRSETRGDAGERAATLDDAIGRPETPDDRICCIATASTDAKGTATAFADAWGPRACESDAISPQEDHPNARNEICGSRADVPERLPNARIEPGLVGVMLEDMCGGVAREGSATLSVEPSGEVVLVVRFPPPRSRESALREGVHPSPLVAERNESRTIAHRQTTPPKTTTEATEINATTTATAKKHSPVTCHAPTTKQGARGQKPIPTKVETTTRPKPPARAGAASSQRAAGCKPAPPSSVACKGKPAATSSVRKPSTTALAASRARNPPSRAGGGAATSAAKKK